MSKPGRGNSTPRELPDEGQHSAICKIVADLGTQKSNNPDWADRHTILLLFELTELSTKQKPAYQTLQLTFTDKSKGLLKTMKAWQGVKKLSDYDMEDALNKPANITIEHNGEYANITAVTAPIKGQKIPKGFMSPLALFLDDTFDAETFESLPEWVKDKIMDSPEYEEVSAPKGKGRVNKNAASGKGRK